MIKVTLDNGTVIYYESFQEATIYVTVQDGKDVKDSGVLKIAGTVKPGQDFPIEVQHVIDNGFPLTGPLVIRTIEFLP